MADIRQDAASVPSSRNLAPHNTRRQSNDNTDDRSDQTDHDDGSRNSQLLDDADRCLLRNSALLALSRPDAAGFLLKKANLSGWYRYWFSLHGSQLMYFEVVCDNRRGPLVGTISLFRNKLILAHSPKRPREIDLLEAATRKTHVLRPESDAQMHWWLNVFAVARNKVPPPKPFATSTLTHSLTTLPSKQKHQEQLQHHQHYRHSDKQRQPPLIQHKQQQQQKQHQTTTRAAPTCRTGLGIVHSMGDPPSHSTSNSPPSLSSSQPVISLNPRHHDRIVPSDRPWEGPSLSHACDRGLQAQTIAPVSVHDPRSSSAAPAVRPSTHDQQHCGSSNMAPALKSTTHLLNQNTGMARNSAISVSDKKDAFPAEQVRSTTPVVSPTVAPVSAPDVPSANAMPNTSVDGHLPVDHVLFVVHGIGVSDDALSENIRMLQESYLDVATKIFPDLNFRVEILVVRWRDALTKLDVHQRLKAVVPIAPSISDESNPLRHFMVNRIVDYVYYTHDRYRRHILRTVAMQLNELLAEFMNRRPDYRGPISIYCHSLGAALCFDLLCRKYRDDQTLLAAEEMLINFEVDSLFMAGSPLGTFLNLDPSLVMGADIRNLPFRLYNIFHPNDPIATRLEPYIEPSFVGIHPVVVPYWCNMGIRSSTAQWLGTLWSGTSSKNSSIFSESRQTESSGDAAIGKANFHGSVDRCAAIGSCNDSVVAPDARGLSSDRTRRSHSSDCMSSSFPPIQPSPGQIGIGSRVEADRTALGRASFEPEMKYLPEAAQADILRAGVFEKRLDFVLQLSSAIEEVSTSWSALRAHIDYWSNRDMMLFLTSCMIKSSCNIQDSTSKLIPIDVDSRIIDSRVHLKDMRVGWADEDTQFATQFSDLGCMAQSLDHVVQVFVEKIIDESSAMHELLQQHPHIRLLSGGITRSTSSQKQREQTSPTSKVVVDKYSGWVSYLPWFGTPSSSQTLSSTQDAGSEAMHVASE